MLKNTDESTFKTPENYKTVLIVRDEGSNGDMEMGAFFKLGGFNVLNYNHFNQK